MTARTALLAPLHSASEDQDAPVRGSLDAAVAELQRIAASADHLQNALSPMLRRGGEGTDAAQALDAMTQHLHGLADFLTVVARECPAGWRLDATSVAACLPLQAQKLRLTFDAAPHDAALHEVGSSPTTSSGELELW